MSANPLIYCLEHLTDYRQFERLSSDLMAGVGYKNIEPIGGTGDRGRDAIVYCQKDNSTTVFAYTVRSDWWAKLRSDCRRIREENHQPDCVVFVCTSTLSGSDRDTAKQKIKTEFGWDLEIFDIERIRVLLAGELRHLIPQHSAIFCPPWFPTKGGITLTESRDTIIIDHTVTDHSLATWLARRLSISGFKTWCYGISPFVGEDRDETIRTLLDYRAVQYLPVISHGVFLLDTDFIGRIGIANQKDKFVITCWGADMDDLAKNTKILQSEPARFDNGWSVGLKSLLKGLESNGVLPNVESDQGKAIALKAYMPEPVTKLVSEKVYANVFSVTVPKSIMICLLSRDLNDNEINELRKTWAFVKVSTKKLLSFAPPPKEVPLINAPRIAEYLWSAYTDREGRNSVNAVKELIRRSLTVASASAGLELCPERNVYYFSENDNKQNKIHFTHVDGRKTHVSVTGTKQDGWGDRATKFKYQLSPSFRVWIDDNREFWVTTRIYVRVTSLEGVPYREKEIIRKRKKVTKNWWNKEWLARTIGVMQGLANTDSGDAIEVGSEKKRKLSVSVRPLEWECPISIDVEAVDRIGDFQAEMASMREVQEEVEGLGVSQGGEQSE